MARSPKIIAALFAAAILAITGAPAAAEDGTIRIGLTFR
jgi:hypothetical protein